MIHADLPVRTSRREQQVSSSLEQENANHLVEPSSAWPGLINLSREDPVR
jgi:hypothetical protein